MFINEIETIVIGKEPQWLNYSISKHHRARNAPIPSKLKHYIDIITQPGLSFSFSPETGYSGLVTGKPAAVIYARGGEYSSSDAAAGMDFQKRYLEMWLGFIGFTDITSILVEPTLSDPSDTEKALNQALELATAVARKF
jgi:FMN-dependent NADH-azoreductase